MVLQFFEFFCYFFRNFLARVEYVRNSRVKFCFHFFGLSQPVFAKNSAGNRFYNFLNFITTFFGIFLLGSSMNGILEQNFVFTFSTYLIPYWLKIMTGRGFTIFWIFLLFFSEFSCSGRVWTEFWSKILFSLFRLISSPFTKNNAGKRFYNFLNFLTIFLGILLLGSSINGILE